MSVAPPTGFILYSTGTLELLFTEHKELHSHMQSYVAQTYTTYLKVLAEATTHDDFFRACYDLSFSIKQGYSFFVKGLELKPLIKTLDKTSVCAYMSYTGYLCAHVDVVPENVKSIHYLHIPFTSLLH